MACRSHAWAHADAGGHCVTHALQDAYGRWYIVHLSALIPAVALLLVAFALALACSRPIPHSLHHFQLGVAVFIMAMLQPFSAIPRYMTHHVGSCLPPPLS